jgi:alkanesulfonate monooxygenase SsuD/methylene tetrahydromethanopterin reductase-like flavin-dependent oxidoreductase (luciferase family)
MNEDWFGVPFSKPATRTKELIELLRAVFKAGNGLGFRFQGKFWNLNVPVFTRPGARENLPILLAAVNDPMMRTAGAVADGLVGHPIATRRWHRERTLPALREAEAKAGREAGACRLVPYVMTSIQQNRDLAVQDAKNQIGFYFTVKVYHTILAFHGLPEVAEACRKALRTFDVRAMSQAIPDSLVDEIAIACTPDEARDRLAQWEGLTDEALFYAPTVGVPPERVRENLGAILDLFGR